jgi:hypothetical protein
MGTLALAQEQRPLPRGAPEAQIPPATVSIEVWETLDPDRLRSLARPHVTAWMRTTSNTLAESTVENLQRFDVAWVELKAPLSVDEAAEFGRLPRAGAWGSLEAMEVARQRLPGSRRLAVNLQVPLDDAVFERLARLRPAVIRWTPPGPIDLLSWGLFRALGGRKVLVVTPELLRPVRCERRVPTEPALEVHLAQLLAMNSEVFPCGLGARIRVGPETAEWLLQSLLVRDPSAELVVSIGADAALASRAARLLDALGLGAPR